MLQLLLLRQQLESEFSLLLVSSQARVFRLNQRLLYQEYNRCLLAMRPRIARRIQDRNIILYPRRCVQPWALRKLRRRVLRRDFAGALATLRIWLVEFRIGTADTRLVLLIFSVLLEPTV